ncbi:DISP1 [Symbiodinium necroappetens]|uniref:DISP1 protein n=1 Tax=Symbiodinium necroappetens TaxID=1628268 RepID=A0A813BTT9_9DINO|nr:DISP1 [Symbiodinium necroappetens]
MSTIDRATTKVATWYVRRPCTCFVGCLFMMFALSGLSAGLGYMNLMTREDTWMILDGEMTQHYRAYRAARESVLEEFQADDADDDQDYDQERLFFFYKTDVEGTGTLFTPERLVSICEIEKTMLANNSLVKAVPTGDSVLGLFYGTAANPAMQSVPAARTIAGYDWSCQKLSQSDVDSVVDTMHTDLASKGPQSLYARFVDPNFRETKQTAYSRTFAELQVLKSDDEVKVMEPAFEKLGLAYGFLRSAFQGDEDRFVQSGDIRVRVTYTGINEIQKMALPDFGLSFFSVILVFGVSWVHMRSSFMASAALLMMILTLPIASLFYQGVFRIEYFEFLHILVVYLVLGIGADDVYVFKDTFCHVKKAEFPFAQPGRLTEDQEIRVLSLTFQRAGTAIFNTSFTTALAFASCSVSKAMPMRTCGWYAATCIVTLYVLTLIYYPPVVILWHRRLQSKRCCCPGLTERPTAVVPEGMSKEKKMDQEESSGLVERFFEKLYIPVMSKQVGGLRIYALFLALLLLAVAIQGVAFAMQLTPPRSEEVWFPGNHMLLSLQDFMTDNFYTPSSDNYAVVTIFLGIAGLDKTGIQVYDPGAFTGTAIYDDAFDLSTAEAQSALLGICDKVHNITCDLQGCDNSGYDQKTFLMQTSERTDACFLKDFQTWLNGPLPTGANFTAQLKNFRDNAVVGDYYGDVMKKEVDFKEDIGFIGGELKYVAIKFRSVMKKRLPFSIGTEVRDMLREWMDQQRGPLPSSLQSIKFHGNGEFQRYDMGEELINGLFSGIAIAMPVSFLVLLSSTRNMVVAIYAVLTVGSIVLCVLGFCKSAMDWDLGIGEAIAGVIVIGYSVDYVVHLAHMYCEAKHFGHETRDDRAKFAIRNMGSTIFAGALTTMLAGATMFMCFFYFFIKMALLICVTIMYSFLYSLIFFMAVLWLAGPEYNFGYLRLPKWCAGGSHKDDVAIVNKDVQESNTADAGKPAKAHELDEGLRTIQVP